MNTRRLYIERLLRNIYGGQPPDDSTITVNLVNSYLSTGVAVAAKQSYTDALKLDGIEYVNNSFYTTFKNLDITPDDSCNQCFSISLPQIPVGVGKNKGIGSLKFKSKTGVFSLDAIPISMSQVAYVESMRTIPNKILYWNEGSSIKFKTSAMMIDVKASVRMISGGDSSDLDSEFVVPEDYYPIIEAYVKTMLLEERSRRKDAANDGIDSP